MGSGRPSGKARLKGEYFDTGQRIEGVKVLQRTGNGKGGMPRFSNTPNTMYILQTKGGTLKALGIYDSHRELTKTIDIDHGHTNRPKSGKKQKLKKGIAHVHNHKGGRENNVRYMTPKEKKKYRKIIIAMGGRTE